MAKSKKLDLEDPAPILVGEDEETLAAIDEGIRDAEAGRVVPAEKVREQMDYWIRLAEEMARNGRANIAADKKRLQQILAERERNQSGAPQSSETPTTLSQSTRKNGAPS
jgi:hypothetical protein